MLSIFTYTDYRKYLKDYYKNKKKDLRKFSYQAFAKKAGFKTNSYLIDIINGKKPLSKNRILDVTTALGLKKKETEFFECLVSFTHAKRKKDKEFYYRRLKTLAGKNFENLVQKNQYDYYSTWYHTVIRELVVMKGFKGNYKALGQRVSPPITAKQAQESVALLLSLGLIKRTAAGRYRQAKATLHTGDEIKSLAVYRYQKETLNMSQRALEEAPAKTRDISTVTAGLSREGFETFKKELQDFRRRLLQLANEEKKPDRVYHLNLQFFPASNLPDTGEE